MGIAGGICPSCRYGTGEGCEVSDPSVRSCVGYDPSVVVPTTVTPQEAPPEGRHAVAMEDAGVYRTPRVAPVVTPAVTFGLGHSGVSDEDWYNEDGWERRMYGEC